MDDSQKSSHDDPDPGPDPQLWDPFPGIGEGGSSSAAPALTNAAVAALRKEKGRVRFNSSAALEQPVKILPSPTIGPPESPREPTIPKPRPSVLRGSSTGSVTTLKDINDKTNEELESEESLSAAARAQERAKQVAEKLQRNSPTPSSRASLESNAETATSSVEFTQATSHDPILAGMANMAGQSIPLQNMSAGGSSNGHSNGHSRQDSGQTEIEDGEHVDLLREHAAHLVRAHTMRFGPKSESEAKQKAATGSGGNAAGNGSGGNAMDDTNAAGSSKETLVEVNDGQFDGVYNVPPPQEYRGSVLAQLLKLYKPPDFNTHHNRNSVASLPGTPGTGSGAATPTTPKKKWYDKNRSQDTLANLVEASARLANPKEKPADPKPKKPTKHRRTASAGRLTSFWQQEEARITVHIAETLSRQEYIIKMCRALMIFGAPTHRLEEYLSMTARVLEIDGQFLYLPGCMIISFDDKSLHTTEVRIVRTAQGIDLGKLKDVHQLYKEVMHDVIGVEEATLKLDALLNAKDKFGLWTRVLVFGLTSVTAAPFSFKARLIDLPLCFCLGCLVGVLQLFVASKSNIYSNVLEVVATVIVSFLARAFGSIHGGKLFCFSALAQGGITMLLPGYMVLCSALELQSRAIIAGSIRIVYAIIYCLLLGFGIMVGAALYGLFDSHASNVTQCPDPMPAHYAFIFVPFFVVCICILYQAKWRQMPVMIVIAFAGYIVNYYSSLRFVASPQIANTLGALSVGVLANLYSRIRHGVAAATLVPAIFSQVPGGLASSGGLLSGLNTANLLTNGTSAEAASQAGPTNTVIFDVAARMIQIAIGIAVGLFISALCVYPLGKRRSGLFSF